MNVHHVVAVGTSIIQDVGIEAIVSVVVWMLCIVGLARLHAILVHMVLGRSVGCCCSCKEWRSSVSVELVTKLVGKVAIIRMLYLEDRLL